MTQPITPTGFQWVAAASQDGVDVTVWRRRRTAGDGGYTVTSAAVGVRMGMLLTVRGASDSYVPTVGAVGVGRYTSAVSPPLAPTVARPSLLLVVAASMLESNTGRDDTIPAAAQTFTADAGARHTTVGVVALADAGIAPATPATFPTSAAQTALVVQLLIPSDASVAQRVIATVPISAMQKSGLQARLTGRVKFTTPDLWLWQDVSEQGTWDRLRQTKSSWANVKSTTSTAGDDYMRLYVDVVYQYGNTTTIPGTSATWNTWVARFTGPNRAPLNNVIISAMYVIRTGLTTPQVERDLMSGGDQLIPLLKDIHTTPTRSAYLLSGAIPLTAGGQPVNLIDDELAVAVIACDVLGLAITAAATTVPTGTVITQSYVAPVQVIRADAARTGQWVDFSFLFNLTTDLPDGAVIRFMHGTNVREFATSWQLDRIGVTSGPDRDAHGTLYYLDGDTAVPAQPEDYLLPEGIWSDVSGDARIVWSGTAGRSPSQFYGPSRVSATSRCRIDAPDAPGGFRQPIFLNDPIAPARGAWYEMTNIGDLVYAARRSLQDVLGRGSQIAVSSTRGWAQSTVTVLTRTLQQRQMALATFQTGRVLLLRNPDPRYPETTWYLSVGDVTERRLSEGDQRRGERLWEIPFVQVERPVGLIEQAAGRTWERARDEFPTWEQLRASNDTWLELLYPTDVVVPPIEFDGTLYPSAPNAYPGLATFPSSR